MRISKEVIVKGQPTTKEVGEIMGNPWTKETEDRIKSTIKNVEESVWRAEWDEEHIVATLTHLAGDYYKVTTFIERKK